MIIYSVSFQDVLQLSSPTKLHNGGCDEIKMFKEPFRMMAESFHHSGKVLESNQPVYNSSKMVGMIQDSAYGGFYCDTDGAGLENSAICQEEQEVLFGAVLNEYFMQVCCCCCYYYFIEAFFNIRNGSPKNVFFFFYISCCSKT